MDKVTEKLQEWFVNNIPEDKMIFKEPMENQILFIRDHIRYLFLDNIVSIDVISTHRSKSIRLPVYEITLIDGTTLILRNNFYDWKVSVKSINTFFEFPLSLFNHGVNEKIHTCYCEGFDESWVYGVYDKHSLSYTVEISDHYHLYTFMYLLNEQLNSKKDSLS